MRALNFSLISLVLASLPVGAASMWNAADDNITGSQFDNISSFDLDVTETSGPAVGDGFDLSITTVGDPVNLEIGAGGTEARFTITIPLGSTQVSSVDFVVNFDQLAFPLNPDGVNGAGAQRQALIFLRQLGGEDIIGDLNFLGLSRNIENPLTTFENSQTSSGYNGGANFTLDPEDIPGNQFLRFAAVHTLVGGSDEVTHSGLTLNITPDDGGFFEPGSQFRVTFDAGFTPVAIPEPSGAVLVGLGLFGLMARRRR